MRLGGEDVVKLLSSRIYTTGAEPEGRMPRCVNAVLSDATAFFDILI